MIFKYDMKRHDIEIFACTVSKVFESKDKRNHIVYKYIDSIIDRAVYFVKLITLRKKYILVLQSYR